MRASSAETSLPCSSALRVPGRVWLGAQSRAAMTQRPRGRDAACTQNLNLACTAVARRHPCARLPSRTLLVCAAVALRGACVAYEPSTNSLAWCRSRFVFQRSPTSARLHRPLALVVCSPRDGARSTAWWSCKQRGRCLARGRCPRSPRPRAASMSSTTQTTLVTVDAASAAGGGKSRARLGRTGSASPDIALLHATASGSLEDAQHDGGKLVTCRSGCAPRDCVQLVLACSAALPSCVGCEHPTARSVRPRGATH